MRNNYILIGILSFIMAGAVIYAFTVSGGPGESRNRQFDDQRTRNISSLKYEIENYYNKNYRLPESLDDLVSDTYASKFTKDPETGENFEYIPYTKSGLTAYQICANFSTDSQKINNNNNNGMYNLSYSGELTHPKGRHCFSFDIAANIYNKNVFPSGMSEPANEVGTPSAMPIEKMFR